MKGNKIECLTCKHYAFWDGNPCCCNTMAIILPDLLKSCENYSKNKNEERIKNNRIFWKKNIKNYFEKNELKLKEPFYSKYIKEHPEYKEFIKHYEEE